MSNQNNQEDERLEHGSNGMDHDSKCRKALRSTRDEEKLKNISTSVDSISASKLSQKGLKCFCIKRDVHGTMLHVLIIHYKHGEMLTNFG